MSRYSSLVDMGMGIDLARAALQIRRLGCPEVRHHFSWELHACVRGDLFCLLHHVKSLLRSTSRMMPKQG